MTAKLSYPDAKSFYTILESLSKLIDEISMTITADGVRMRALDPAHVALIDITLPPEAFVEFDVEGEAKAGFNVPNLVKLLKRSKKGDKLELVVEEDRLTFTIVGATVKRYTIVNLDVPEPEIPEASLEFNVKAEIISDPLKNALKDAETVGDIAELEAKSEDELYIRGKGASISETRISRMSGALVNLEVKEPSKSSYSIDYLKHVLKLTKIADVVRLEFSTNMPLRMEFQLPGSGKVTYLLAPKLE